MKNKFITLFSFIITSILLVVVLKYLTNTFISSYIEELGENLDFTEWILYLIIGVLLLAIVAVGFFQKLNQKITSVNRKKKT